MGGDFPGYYVILVFFISCYFSCFGRWLRKMVRGEDLRGHYVVLFFVILFFFGGMVKEMVFRSSSGILVSSRVRTSKYEENEAVHTIVVQNIF